MSLLGVWAILVFVAGSAFLSSSEIALFSLSRFQIRALKDRYPTVHRSVKKLLGDPGGLLITILVLNEAFNVLISSIVAQAVVEKHFEYLPYLHRLPAWFVNTGAGLLFTAPILLLACEITPKVIAARVNLLITLGFARGLHGIYIALTPIRWVLSAVIRLLSFSSRKTLEADRAQQALLKESEFLMMIEEGHKEGALQESEVELIKNVFDLDDTPVSAVATPVARVHMLSKSTTLKGALQAYQQHRFSRVPVYAGNRKKIVGVLYAKDLLRARLDTSILGQSIETVLRKPFFVSQDLRLNALFRRFKQQKTHLAVVHDEKGMATGVVTMSDVLDELLSDVIPEERHPMERHPL